MRVTARSFGASLSGLYLTQSSVRASNRRQRLAAPFECKCTEPALPTNLQPLLSLTRLHPGCPIRIQVFNVATSPLVQNAWDSGQTLAVHGLVYALTDGILKVGVRCRS